jgi:calcium-activated chloride channel regulator 4
VLESFSRTATGDAFVMSDVPSGPLPDLFPPSQITDLHATLDGDKINLTWTAPGDDFDVGTGKNGVMWFDLSERSSL